MKWIASIAAIALLAGVACADELEEEGSARLGYITVGSGGSTTLTFNATSIQNAVILGLFILVLGALILPLFGVSMDGYLGEDDAGYGYGYEAPSYSSGYEEPASYHGNYAKRSLEMFGPVVEALSKAKEKYE